MTYFRQKYKPPKSTDEKYELDNHISKQDFTKFCPNKRMEKLSLPSGLYGFTYLNADYMVINNNLQDEKNYETQVHESIHTNDEYETRILTWWMLNLFNQDEHYVHLN